MSAGVVERVDPARLEVAANVRREVQLTKEFVSSVKQHGVLVPIIVQEGLDGYAVIDGQRRTLAAVEAGVNEVPVVVVDPLAKDTDRIVQQLVVNDQRAALTQADEVAAVQELALFGMSATAIAKKIGAKKADVDVVIKVGSSEGATKAMREYEQVTFDAAAVIAEFEDDPEAQASLIEQAAMGYYIQHEAQRWRDRRAAEVVAAEIEATEGVTLIDRPSYSQSDPLELSMLFTDSDRKHPLSDLPHEELVKLVSDGLCGFPEAEGYGEERRWGVGYAVKGWRARGLFTHPWRDSGPSKPSTPEEVAALKEERRQARENTKAWVSASAVRIGWLQAQLARKGMPSGWELVVARHLVQVHASGYSSTQWGHVINLLQIKDDGDAYSRREAVAKYLEANPTRAAAVAIAGALGSIEGGFEFERKGWQQQSVAADYLKLLAGWGYELSEIERTAAGLKA